MRRNRDHRPYRRRNLQLSLKHRTVSAARLRTGDLMTALGNHGPGNEAWEQVPDPIVIDSTDAIAIGTGQLAS